MLSNAYFLAKFRFDTAENEPAKNLQNFANFPNFANFVSPSRRTSSTRFASAVAASAVAAVSAATAAAAPGRLGFRRALGLSTPRNDVGVHRSTALEMQFLESMNSKNSPSCR